MAKIIKSLAASTAQTSAADILETNAQQVAAQGGLPQGEMEVEQEPAPAKTITAPKAADTANEIVTLVLPKETRETEVYLITPKGDAIFGTDRWFAKKDLKGVDVKDGIFHIQLARKQVASRGLTAALSEAVAH